MQEEYKLKTTENIDICPCGNVFGMTDDYDSLGSDSGVCCPDCGNEKFITVESLKQQRDDLLEACKEAQKIFGFIAENYKSAPHFPTAERLVEAALAKCKA